MKIDYRFIVICILMLLIWSSLLTFWWMKTEEITKDPCSICAERHGDTIMCTSGFTPVQYLEYYPNGSINKIIK